MGDPGIEPGVGLPGGVTVRCRTLQHVALTRGPAGPGRDARGIEAGPGLVKAMARVRRPDTGEARGSRAAAAPSMPYLGGEGSRLANGIGSRGPPVAGVAGVGGVGGAMEADGSNGWEAVAARFAATRSAAGTETVRRWAETLPAGGSVVDVGAGTGIPLTAVLVERGLRVRAVDASPAMVAAFRARLPGVPIICEPAERSAFEGGPFDGVLAVGLVFLLPAAAQSALIRRMAGAVRPGGRLLFSAPRPACAWDDTLTGRRSESLGAEAYGRLLAACGMEVLHGHVDSGGNRYHEARRRAGAWPAPPGAVPEGAARPALAGAGRRGHVGAMRKPAHIVEKERARRAEARETHWLFGIHAVAAALANPARERLRLVATRNAAARLGELHGAIPEIADARAFPVPLDPGSVHQGAALETRALDWPPLEELADGRPLVMLDRVSDPHNVGAILRSAEVFGARRR